MIPQSVVIDSVAASLANLDKFKVTDPGTAAATNNYAWLIPENFTENDAVDIDTLGIAADDSGILAKIGIGYGAQNESRDPVNGDIVIEMKPLAAVPWRWESTDDNAPSYPMTIHGYCVTNHLASELLLVKKFDPPKVITANNQAITVEKLEVRVPKNSFS